MKFNDTVSSTGICQDIDFWVDTDTTSYPLVDKARNVNAWYRTVVAWIWRAGGGWEFDDTNLTDLPVLTTPLVANQKDYALPTDYGEIDRLEVKDESGIWTKLTPLTKGQLGIALDEFQKTSNIPIYYDLFANSLKLYPASSYAQAASIKIYLKRDIDEFTSTDTSQAPGFNKNFHRLLSYGGALDYALANGITKKITQINVAMANMRADLEEYYKKRDNDLARRDLRMIPGGNRKPAI